MNNDLTQLHDWVAPLISQLAPTERRRLAVNVGRKLATAQRRRIAQQKNPDGTAFEPRQRTIRSQRGRIGRQAMFTKIRQARFLKVQSTPEGIMVGFSGAVARIARTHQYGLRDRVARGGPVIRYPQRQLLGFTDAEQQLIMDEVLQHLAATPNSPTS